MVDEVGEVVEAKNKFKEEICQRTQGGEEEYERTKLTIGSRWGKWD